MKTETGHKWAHRVLLVLLGAALLLPQYVLTASITSVTTKARPRNAHGPCHMGFQHQNSGYVLPVNATSWHTSCTTGTSLRIYSYTYLRCCS